MFRDRCEKKKKKKVNAEKMHRKKTVLQEKKKKKGENRIKKTTNDSFRIRNMVSVQLCNNKQHGKLYISYNEFGH